MAFKDWFSRPTPLQLAIQRGLQPGADLSDELRALGEYPIREPGDAEAICEALRRVAADQGELGGESALPCLADLFGDVEDASPAFEILAGRGHELLMQIVDFALHNPSRYPTYDVLTMLSILAMCGTPQGTDMIVRAARGSVETDHFMWFRVLRPYVGDHPQRDRLFAFLSNPLPQGFLRIALLDTANEAAMKGIEFQHPFQTVAGVQQLESWLRDPDEDRVSYAVSAAVALAFVRAPNRSALFALAFDHPNPDVQIEAAWAAARLGSKSGVAWLARACCTVNQGARALRYLNELGLTDAIPPEAQDEDFQALADFAEWLAHPNELGHPPDELRIVDRRVLHWPPEREPRTMRLIEFRDRDRTGLRPDRVERGLVGSVTFCLFFFELAQRPAEDAYALHCYWELEHRDLISALAVPESSTEYDSMLEQVRRQGLDAQRIVHVAEMSPELRYPQPLVGVAEGVYNGRQGWAVIDGPRSRWYAAAEMPANTSANGVLGIHIGRLLLGFGDEQDRASYLRPPERKSPEDLIRTYERLLRTARSDPKQARKILGYEGALGEKFSEYVAASAVARSRTPAQCACAAYEAMVGAARAADSDAQEEIFSCHSVALAEAFEPYIDAMVELKRQDQFPKLLEIFLPHWQKSSDGFHMLAKGAFKCGRPDLADKLLIEYRNKIADWLHDDTTDSFAEIWLQQGRPDLARMLLINALQWLQHESRQASARQRQRIDRSFASRRATFLRLFPQHGDAELRRQGIQLGTTHGPHAPEAS